MFLLEPQFLVGVVCFLLCVLYICFKVLRVWLFLCGFSLRFVEVHVLLECTHLVDQHNVGLCFLICMVRLNAGIDVWLVARLWVCSIMVSCIRMVAGWFSGFGFTRVLTCSDTLFELVDVVALTWCCGINMCINFVILGLPGGWVYICSSAGLLDILGSFLISLLNLSGLQGLYVWFVLLGTLRGLCLWEVFYMCPRVVSVTCVLRLLLCLLPGVIYEPDEIAGLLSEVGYGRLTSILCTCMGCSVHNFSGWGAIVFMCYSLVGYIDLILFQDFGCHFYIIKMLAICLSVYVSVVFVFQIRIVIVFMLLVVGGSWVSDVVAYDNLRFGMCEVLFQACEFILIILSETCTTYRLRMGFAPYLRYSYYELALVHGFVVVIEGYVLKLAKPFYVGILIIVLLGLMVGEVCLDLGRVQCLAVFWIRSRFILRIEGVICLVLWLFQLVCSMLKRQVLWPKVFVLSIYALKLGCYGDKLCDLFICFVPDSLHGCLREFMNSFVVWLFRVVGVLCGLVWKPERFAFGLVLEVDMFDYTRVVVLVLTSGIIIVVWCRGMFSVNYFGFACDLVGCFWMWQRCGVFDFLVCVRSIVYKCCVGLVVVDLLTFVMLGVLLYFNLGLDLLLWYGVLCQLLDIAKCLGVRLLRVRDFAGLNNFMIVQFKVTVILLWWFLLKVIGVDGFDNWVVCLQIVALAVSFYLCRYIGDLCVRIRCRIYIRMMVVSLCSDIHSSVSFGITVI
eukprot:gene2726-1711_t